MAFTATDNSTAARFVETINKTIEAPSITFSLIYRFRGVCCCQDRQKMGFPRILSKNNKIYTKLGEFCLSLDGNQFFIVCHTCQQELLTQDTFWKHIQDEHNFLHELKRDDVCNMSEQNRTQAGESCAADGAIDVAPLPTTATLVQQYCKSNIKAEQRQIEKKSDDTTEGDEGEGGPKDYTEMRVVKSSPVDMDIKVEQQPHSVNKEAINSQHHQGPVNRSQMLNMPNATRNVAVMAPHILSGCSSVFQSIPQVCTALPAIGITLPPDSGAMTAEPKALVQPLLPTLLKDSPSATSEDSERYYICDYSTCGLKFKYQSRLTMHRSVHSKVRRFACDLCDASFKQSCNLSTHRKKKHNVRTARMLMNE